MRALVIHNRLPKPEQSGSDVRLMQILSALREMGEVTLVVSWLIEEADTLTHLEALGIEVFHGDAEQLRYYGIDRIPQWSFQDLLRTRNFHTAILTLWFWTAFTMPEQYLPQIRLHAPKTRVLILSDDQHGRREADLARLLADPLATIRAEDTAFREHETYLRADGILTVSQEDQLALSLVPAIRAPVHQIPFERMVRDQSPSFLERSGVLYLGNFTNPCVSEAAQWLVSSIWPLIRQANPGIYLTLAGFGSEAFADLSAEDIRVVGFVDDLDGIFDEHRLFVSPLRAGTGVATKNIMAMSAGLPVITTSVGTHGLASATNDSPQVANDANSIANAVTSFYDQPLAWSALQKQCRALVAESAPGEMRAMLQSAIQAVLQVQVVAPSTLSFSVRFVDDVISPLQYRLPPALRRESRVNAYLSLAEELLARGLSAEAGRQLGHAVHVATSFRQGQQYLASILTHISSCHQATVKPSVP